MRAKYNPPYKRGGTEIDPVIVRRDEWEYPKSWLALSYHNTFRLSIEFRWTKVSEWAGWMPVLNGLLLCRQGLRVVEKSFSVLLVIQDTRAGQNANKETHAAGL